MNEKEIPTANELSGRSMLEWLEDVYHHRMPCGHEARYVVASDEGTSYCALCELEGIRIKIADLRAALLGDR